MSSLEKENIFLCLREKAMPNNSLEHSASGAGPGIRRHKHKMKAIWASNQRRGGAIPGRTAFNGLNILLEARSKRA